MRALLHPAHGPVMAGFEPALQLQPGVGTGIGAREATGFKAEPLGFFPYCFLQRLTGIHAQPTTPFALSLSKGCL